MHLEISYVLLVEEVRSFLECQVEVLVGSSMPRLMCHLKLEALSKENRRLGWRPVSPERRG